MRTRLSIPSSGRTRSPNPRMMSDHAGTSGPASPAQRTMMARQAPSQWNVRLVSNPSEANDHTAGTATKTRAPSSARKPSGEVRRAS